MSIEVVARYKTSPIEIAVRILGGPSIVAAHCELQSHAVNMWIARGRTPRHNLRFLRPLLADLISDDDLIGWDGQSDRPRLSGVDWTSRILYYTDAEGRTSERRIDARLFRIPIKI